MSQEQIDQLEDSLDQPTHEPMNRATILRMRHL